jgi:hypothetical protein
VKLRPNREPCGLTRWVFSAEGPCLQLFTCARPGRTLGRKKKTIDDAAVIDWLNGLPAAETLTAIVSLLGRKPEPNGQSEFSYYSFRSRHEDRPGSPTFQEWLDRATAPGRYVVIEHPTTDTRPIPLNLMNEITASILENLGAMRTVVVVDSGGVSRTGAVIRQLGVKLNSRIVASPITCHCPSR